MSASMLPLVGAHAMITGMAAFMNNARSVNSTLVEMGRSAYYLERTSSRAFGGMEASFAGAMGGVIKVAAVTAGAIAALAAGAIVLGQRYGKDLAFIGAITESTSGEIAKLNTTQLEMARTTNVATLELQKASGELLKAGQSIGQVTDESLKAANAMVVASNGELDLARAANIIQVSMAAFSDTQTTATQAANAATAAVQRGTLTFTGYADALKQGGPGLAQMGYTIEQFGALVGVASQQLISGTEIGTGLRVAIQRLQAPTEDMKVLMKEYGISLYDANGAAREVFDVLVDLENKFGDAAVKAGELTAQERDNALAKLFGARTGKVLAAVLDEGTKKYIELLDATEHGTDVYRIAAIILSDTANQLAILGNNAQVAGIAFNQGLDPYINSVVSSLVKLAQSIPLGTFSSLGEMVGSTLYNAFANLGNIIGEFGKLWAPMLSAVANLASAFMGLLNVTRIGGEEFESFGSIAATALEFLWKISIAAFNAVVGAINLASEAINNVTGFLLNLQQAAQDTGTAVGELFVNHVLNAIDTVTTFISTVLLTPPVLDAMKNALIVVVAAVQLTGQFVMWLAGVVSEWVRVFGEASNAVAQAAGTFAQNVGSAWNAFNAVAAEAINSVLGALSRFVGGLAPVGGAAAAMANTWASAWSGIAGVAGRAVRWVLGKVNDLLNGLASIPIIGEAISGARAAVDGFLGSTASFAASVSNTVGGAVAQAQGAISGLVTKIQSVKLPDIAFKNFAADVKASFDKVKTDRDDLLKSLQRKPAAPDRESEAGDPLDNKAGDDAKKAAEKAAKEIAELMARAEELVRDFNDDVDKQTRVTTNDIIDLYADAATKIAESMQDATREINEATQDVTDRVAEMFSDRDLEADAKKRTDDLEDLLKEEVRIRELGLEDTEVLHQRELEDAKIKYDAEVAAAQRRNDDILEGEARARDFTREDEDRAFAVEQRNKERALDKTLDLEEKALDKQQNLRDDALQLQQDAEERALDKILQAEEDAQKRRLDVEKDALKAKQDLREAALQTQLDNEARTRDQTRDLAEITGEDTTARAKAQAEYSQEIAIGVKKSIAQTRLNEKLRDIQEETQKARAAFELRKTEGEADLAFEAQQEVKLQALRVKFAEEDTALEIQQQATSLALREQHEQRVLDLRADHERQAFILREKFEEEATKLREEHERRRLALEEDTSNRRRTRAEEDRRFADRQEEKRRVFAEKQEADGLIESRRIQDEELKRRRGLDILETAFKKDQEDRRAALSKKLDNEDFQRKLDTMQLEHDKKILQINTTLAEEQEKTRAKLAQDITDLNTNLKERIDAIREQYIDRLQDILEKGGDQLRPVVDGITGHIDTSLQGIRDSAQEVVDALKEVFTQTEAVTAAANALDAARAAASSSVSGGRTATSGDVASGVARREGGKIGETASEVENFLKNQAAAHAGNIAVDAAALAGIGVAGAAATIARALSLQYGGMVPGKYGESQLAEVHGGEQYLGIGAAGTTLAAVQAAEAMSRRGTQGGMTVNYNYDWDVNATYPSQSPASVGRDLSALVALTRG